VSDVLYERTESDAEFAAVLGDVRYATEPQRRETAQAGPGGAETNSNNDSRPVNNCNVTTAAIPVEASACAATEVQKE
jgi:hypothetical protein